jgi:hypothetical protein
MNRRKSLLHYLGEAIDRYRAEQTVSTVKETSLTHSSGHLNRIVRWFIPNGGTLLLVIALIATAQVWARPLASPTSAPGPSATTVNYQGRLSDSDGVPLDGTYGMSFALYDAATDGSLVWGPEEHTAVEVSDGLFSVGLGSKTSGGIPTTTWNGDRYLEITVSGETLAPRELIRSVPIAGMALTVPDGAIGSSQIASNSISTEHFAQGLVFKLPSLSQVVRDMQTAIPAIPDYVTVGDSSILLNEPGKIHAVCSVTIQPDSTPKQWISLKIIAQNGAEVVEMSDYVYHGTASSAYTNISTPAILSLPAGNWTIQCRLARKVESGDDPILHTYSITALQIE